LQQKALSYFVGKEGFGLKKFGSEEEKKLHDQRKKAETEQEQVEILWR